MKLRLMLVKRFSAKLLFGILISTSTLVFYSNPIAAQDHRYETEEFRTKDHDLPVMFLCVFIAEQYKLYPGALDMMLDSLIAIGVTPQRFDAWENDATYFVAASLDRKKPIDVWRENDCDLRMSALKRAVDE